MSKVHFNFLKIRELAKLLYNPIFAFYARFLKIIGVIDFAVPPNSNMRRTSAKTIWRYWYSGLTTALPINVHAQIAGIDPVKENQILDFGCGVGGQIRVMKEYFPNSQFTGCDVDPSSIDWLSKTYKEYNFVKSVASEELNYLMVVLI